MMIKPSIEQLTKGEINRYALVIATAKCARIVTDEYVDQREKADRLVANKMTDKPISALIDPDLRNNKAVENAVQRIARGDYKIITPKK
ncbi:MAG: hypothetical protein KBS59_06240 [Clostridiales bacterium]|nr:hypothetical protein [Clostridiales bacterium]